MKSFIQFVIVIILFVACNKASTNEKELSTYVSVIVDITDPIEVRPDPDPILSLYHFSDYPDKEAFFRLSIISDKKLNPVVEYHLADGKTTERKNRTGDVQYRAKLILSLYASIRKSMSNFWLQNDSTHSLDHSECFNTIASELGVLSKSSANEKIIVIYGDLLENSGFNSYIKSNQVLLQYDPGEVARQLHADELLPIDLTGITVFFIYRPETREQDQKYELVQGFYKYLLESRGAVVFTKATNNFFIQ